jgi:hypothetical protein
MFLSKQSVLHMWDDQSQLDDQDSMQLRRTFLTHRSCKVLDMKKVSDLSSFDNACERHSV